MITKTNFLDFKIGNFYQVEIYRGEKFESLSICEYIGDSNFRDIDVLKHRLTKFQLFESWDFSKINENDARLNITLLTKQYASVFLI